MRVLGVLLGLILLLDAGSPEVQAMETGFLNRTLELDGADHRYQVYVPGTYDASLAWPVILFLHGSGERGRDGLKQTQVGLGSAIRLDPERWSVIAVFPQAPEGESWSGRPGRVAMAALDATVAEFTVDDARIYLTGLSLGGRGTWQLGYEYPDRFAALVPVCGFVVGNDRYPDFMPTSSTDPYADLAARLAGIPTWIFHGDADPVVPVEESRHMAAALLASETPVKFSELPGVGHNAWDHAYVSEELAEWLLTQCRR